MCISFGSGRTAYETDEAVEQLMKQMSQGQPGDKECKNPKKSKFPGLKSQQQSLKQQLQDMISQMKDGKMKKKMGRKMGKFLQQQEMYQQKLRQMLKNGEFSQTGEKKIRDIMKMIDQNISEIANFSINANTIARQNRILTKLLEAEKAEQERGYDDKREGRTAKRYKLSNPAEIFRKKSDKSNYNSLYQNSRVKLINYYNKLYLDYMLKLEE